MKDHRVLRKKVIYKMSRAGKPIEAGSRFVVTQNYRAEWGGVGDDGSEVQSFFGG